MSGGQEGGAQVSLLGWAEGARVRSAACKAQAVRAAKWAAAIGDQVDRMIERMAERNPEYAERLRAIIVTASGQRAAISEWKRDSTPGQPGVQDRDRASGALQNQVIQGIFTAGLALHDAAGLSKEPEVRWRIEAAADDLDELVRALRDALFNPAG
jgi:hypothetical protein